jgi:hypothetical protein
VVFATPDRRATSSTLRPPSPLSLSSSKVVALILPSCTLAIGHTQTTALFGTDSARPADNHTIIIEFRVEDVDREYARLKPLVSDWVQEPTTMPWGNRSILFRDPDGNLVNFFTPVSEEAIKKFSK